MSRHATGKFHRGNAAPTAWRAAHPEFFRHQEPKLRPAKLRLLRVCTGFYTAGAVWQKIYGVWSVAETAPILHWMRGKSPAEVHLELLRLGAEFQWLDCTPTALSELSSSSMGVPASPTIEAAVRPADGHRLPVKATGQISKQAAPA